MKTSKKIILLIIATLLFSSNVYAKVNVRTKRQGNKVRFYVHNSYSFIVTVTIKFSQLQNMHANTRLPYTCIVGPQQTNRSLIICVKQAKYRWSYRYNFWWLPGMPQARHQDNHLYQLPYSLDTMYKVTQGYNGKISHYAYNQYALDWGMPVGTRVCAARAGTVIAVEERYSKGALRKEYMKKNNYVYVLQADGTTAEYLHFKNNSITVKIGQRVKAGQLLGYSGNVGYSSGPHLHFAVFRPISGLNRQTLPTKFRTRCSLSTSLIEGKAYTAVSPNYERIRRYAKSTAKLMRLRFYESSAQSAPLESRRYSNTFPRLRTRYIYYELYLKNYLWTKRDNPLNFTIKYLTASGRLVGKLQFHHIIPHTHKNHYRWGSWGYKHPGRWRAGRYRVQIYINNAKVGEERFKIK